MKKKIPFWKIVLLTLASSFVVLLVLFIIAINTRLDDNTINAEGTELFGEFTRYDSTVYVVIPGNGYNPVPQVDLKSFHPIGDEYADRHIGIDKNHVFCGNRIMPKMDPKTVKAIGNNYYSDGKTSCYCGRNARENKDLDESKEYLEQLHYLYLKGKKPQSYWYPLKELPNSDSPYFALLNNALLTNGKQVYYEGELMPKANPDSLFAIPVIINQDKQKSRLYLGDDMHVYYKSELLPVTNPKEVYSIKLKPESEQEYLYNPKAGVVYLQGISFNKKNIPYTLISPFGSHTNHALWLSSAGIYFYNTEEKEVQRAGDNPFIDKGFKEIAPFVFSNGKETIYLDAYEKWNHGRTNRSLNSRYTVINRLDDLKKNQTWVKWKDLSTYGSVWKRGTDWYYFDNFGETQLISSTIYKIKDKETVERLLQKDVIGSTRIIRQLIKEKKLKEPKHTEILQAKTKYFSV